MKHVQCITKELVLERKSKGRSFVLEIEDICLLSGSPSPLAIPFVGESGAGKSTLLEALATMMLPSSGQICWQFDEIRFEWGQNKPLLHKDKMLLRSRYFGFAFQETTLSPFLTVMENLTYPQLLQNKPESLAKKHAEDWLDKVFSEEIGTILNKYPFELSGGEKQRVSLIQVICTDPFVLFADEPTGSLDINTRKTVMEVVKLWQEEEGGMFLWVTHHAEDQENRASILQVDKKAKDKLSIAYLVSNEMFPQ